MTQMLQFDYRMRLLGDVDGYFQQIAVSRKLRSQFFSWRSAKMNDKTHLVGMLPEDDMLDRPDGPKNVRPLVGPFSVQVDDQPRRVRQIHVSGVAHWPICANFQNESPICLCQSDALHTAFALWNNGSFPTLN